MYLRQGRRAQTAFGKLGEMPARATALTHLVHSSIGALPPMRSFHRFLVGLLTAISTTAILCAPTPAEAFCGFYVSGAGTDLYNDATVVTLVRDGQRTAMAMQNNYAGPPEDFALVVPVPEVLKKDRVKTIDDGVFERIDKLTAPRLVEYWQRDPCAEPDPMERRTMAAEPPGARDSGAGGGGGEGTVKVEAKFDVGEYEVVVLSSDESRALESWLNDHDYDIPDNAAQYFRPYVEQGSYFFVAKVDIDKVAYEDGEAVLSPLRFHYESDVFKLPVRLGLVNSRGSQDLIAMILARNQRYRVANYPNRVAPTNVPVADGVESSFGSFYRATFDRVMERHPGAVVTEYAWNATSCDPCPVEPLDPADLKTLGTDVVTKNDDARDDARNDGSRSGDDAGRTRSQGLRPPDRPGPREGWVVTRLHTRYSADDLGEDLVFQQAPPITGGRGEPSGREGSFQNHAADEAEINNFQTRFAIRHPWEGDVDCEDPNWDRWGDAPGDRDQNGNAGPRAAGDLGFASGDGEAPAVDRAIQLEEFPVAAPMAGTDGAASTDDDSSNSSDDDSAPNSTNGDKRDPPKQNCRGCHSAPDFPLVALLLLAGAGLRRTGHHREPT